MKNVFLYMWLFVLLSIKVYGQGTDVIFLIDNTNSISSGTGSTPVGTIGLPGSQYNNIYNSVQAIMTEVLGCNPLNKVTVAQFNGIGTGPGIYIESNFTSSSFSFTRRYYGSGGSVWESVNLISSALNGTTPPDGTIQGSYTLSRTPGNALTVFLFTNSPRNNDLLDNTANTNNPNRFSAYTSLKNSHLSKFVVVLEPLPIVSLQAEQIQAAAGIASANGPYTGTVESYPNDPDAATTLGRKLITGFNLSSTQINTLTNFICSCTTNLVLTSPTDDVSTTQDNRQAEYSITASNTIVSNAVGYYHAGETVVLKPGFHSANGSKFRGYIEGCDAPLIEMRTTLTNDEIRKEKNLETNLFSISPNPATSVFTIQSTVNIKHITVTSLDGRVMYNGDVRGKATSYTIDAGSYTQGIYSVTVLTETGETQTQKLIKN
ncbi:T9SS type A sorting domain-containing protein [Flavobacterium sp. Sd200]|uniref:3-coathanger stack domain-containing protein n=1 Tax=Flavobacterium sp. Sd200 TaxID=2692211 RepID=UPI001370CED2|nr:3-coathanger stack domain-containing protein [Flavobacterium sp. Sd200]MXN92701.1 T9SS type A sorting domain-containing protein [Flavobacterium sp. Sd200]